MTYKPISLTITTVVLSLVSFWGGQRLYSQRGASSAPVAAFTAHITQRNIPPPGVTTGAIRITEMIYARRNDRSFVHKVISVASDGTDATVTEIVDTVSKAFTLLEPTTKSKTTYLYTPEKLLRFLNAMESENCGSENAVVTGAPIDEVLSARYRHTVRHISNRTVATSKHIDEESWKIPDLECFAVKEIATRNDGAQVINEVTSLNLGTPPDELFSIPADYTERNPSSVEQLYESKFHRSIYGQDIAATLDKKYYLLRSLSQK